MQLVSRETVVLRRAGAMIFKKSAILGGEQGFT
jgi:hypothetical protein